MCPFISHSMIVSLSHASALSFCLSSPNFSLQGFLYRRLPRWFYGVTLVAATTTILCYCFEELAGFLLCCWLLLLLYAGRGCCCACICSTPTSKFGSTILLRSKSSGDPKFMEAYELSSEESEDVLFKQ
ncbi:hypothetical protein LOK49_LG13G00323 [Camellia lanceoleosa]|uniref:Uncharacterized protein n=1 Tax=Camellia lanceoleosa TaxID=1840588 RepID=A0ACC0FLC8_9ERIC|nr:hypothetical protein LOK49_LG13G00323 [Camellia lanceoleosa]